MSDDDEIPDLTENLKRSAANRKAMLERFGCVPHSILRISRGALSHRMFLFQREKKDRGGSPRKRMDAGIEDASDVAKKHHAERKAKKLLGGRLATAKRNTTSQRARAKRLKAAHGNIAVAPYVGATGRLEASTMPAELVDFFIKYYAKPGDTYLDPFMGQGVQMQVAKLRGMHYRGYDLSAEFFAYIDAVRQRIDDDATTIGITLGDSRHPGEVPDGCGDFSFHSPPYWDIEYYGDEPEQLGSRSYEDFLVGMRDVYAAWLPKFKPGAVHVVNVNDFRKGGRYYSYHADTIRIATEAGWELTDTWVIDGLVGGLPKAFAVDFNLKRIAPKVHEYCLVFKAPK